MGLCLLKRGTLLGDSVYWDQLHRSPSTPKKFYGWGGVWGPPRCVSRLCRKIFPLKFPFGVRFYLNPKVFVRSLRLLFWCKEPPPPLPPLPPFPPSPLPQNFFRG